MSPVARRLGYAAASSVPEVILHCVFSAGHGFIGQAAFAALQNFSSAFLAFFRHASMKSATHYTKNQEILRLHSLLPFDFFKPKRSDFER